MELFLQNLVAGLIKFFKSVIIIWPPLSSVKLQSIKAATSSIPLEHSIFLTVFLIHFGTSALKNF